MEYRVESQWEAIGIWGMNLHTGAGGSDSQIKNLVTYKGSLFENECCQVSSQVTCGDAGAPEHPHKQQRGCREGTPVTFPAEAVSGQPMKGSSL